MRMTEYRSISKRVARIEEDQMRDSKARGSSSTTGAEEQHGSTMNKPNTE